jgi:hypothetical protein
MDKQRAKILVKKINSLFDSISIETSGLSSIERDLMLRYIRDLYEIFLDGEVPVNPPLPDQNIVEPIARSKAAKPEIPKMEQPKFDLNKPKKKVEQPIEKVYTAPPPPPVEVPEPTYSPPVASSNGSRSGIEGLFSFRQAKELSEKLSEQPIRDLQAALSINDKLLYTNELFDRQHNILNDSLTTLNRFENMEQAKSFLMSLAEQYSWDDSEKEEIARSFIKTIRRRYI